MAYVTSSNLLIDAMKPGYRRRLLGDLEAIEIRSNDRLHLRQHRAKKVYFPTGAVISAICHSRGQSIDVRGVGREGMIGAELLSGVEIRRFNYSCQISGTMLHMPAAAFAAYLTQNEDLRRIVATYAGSVLTLTTQSSACNSLHSIAQRCARWLLVTSDRVNSREFLLTHGLLARMLGVGRSGVSLAVAKLQRLGAIAYRMGRVCVLDEAALESHACDCYRTMFRESQGLWAPPKRAARTAR